MARVLQKHACLHLLDHIARVIDHWAVGPERDIYARRLGIRDGADAAASHGFASRRVNEACTNVGHVLRVKIGAMDTVNQQPSSIENSEIHQIAHIGTSRFAYVFEDPFSMENVSPAT